MPEIAMLQSRNFGALKDIPAVRQLVLLVGIAAAVAAGIGAFMWSQQPGYAPLYADVGDRDAAEIADALRAAGVPFRLDAVSGAVTVPAAQVHEARLKLASQGLPKGGAQGFEQMQQDQGFGTSQFVEAARYQHALETELARSVTSLQPVRNARVHLAIPKPSAFTRKGEGPSASVVVELHPGRSLEATQIASIVHMVASSVPGLTPAAVTLIDQYGRLLTQVDGDSDAARIKENFDHARRIEADYVRRIEQLLAPMTGAGRVSAQVTADLDFSVTEEARESYKPDGVLRSEQTSEDSTRAALPAQGVPGATSNQPPTAQPQQPLNPPAATAAAGIAAAAPDAAAQSRSATRNYEIDRTVSHTRQPGGSVRRLSVAVLVDHLPKADDKGVIALAPLSAEELQKVEALVKEAVGFSAARGDSVSVQNASFISADLAVPEPPAWWQRSELRDLGRQALGALVVLVLILAVLRPVLRSLLAGPPRPVMALPLETAAGRELGEDRLSIAAEPAPPMVPAYQLKLDAARSAVAQDPKRVAQLVKNWVGEGG